MIARGLACIVPGVLALLVAGAAHAQTANEDCAPPHRIDWPADQPVWSLCWVSPDNSSGIDGSGLELRDVFYKGLPVLRRAGLPLLNVDYDPGGCGAYRDWQSGLIEFDADGTRPSANHNYIEATRPPRTMCDEPDKEGGNFTGVAAEKMPEHLVLTTQLQSGPYRYTQKWTFRLDGSIDARVAFTARVDPCNVKPHNHHAYWRLEFDIGGDAKDYAEESTLQDSVLGWTRFTTEASRRSDPAKGGRWRVKSAAVQRGYEIVSAPENGVADSWARADFWILKFHSDELDDGGARPGAQGGAVQVDRYVNGESVDGARLVVWVHAMDRHDGSDRCRFVGPTLQPVGQW